MSIFFAQKLTLHYNGILLSHLKKSEILPFGTTWMDREGITLSEISHMEKDKYHMISLICGILKQTKQNKWANKSKHIDTENIVVTKEQGKGWGE